MRAPYKATWAAEASRAPSPATLRHALEALPEPVRRAHARKLTRLSNACGCAEGAVGAVVAVGLVAWHFIATFTDWSLVAVATLIGQLLVAFLAGGFAAKWLGLAVARARLRALCQQLQRQAGPSGS